MALQKFAHGANHYCNFKRTALCGENGPFHLISNPSPPLPLPAPFELLLVYPFRKERSRCRHVLPFRNFYASLPLRNLCPSMGWGGGGNIKWNGPMLCTMTKKNNKKNIINKFYVDFKNNFFKDQKNDTHLLS